MLLRSASLSARTLSTTCPASGFKDMFIKPQDEFKKPSLAEIKKKGLPENTPHLLDRIKRDETRDLYVADRHSGYHKGLTGTWQDFVDPEANVKDLALEGFQSLTYETKRFINEIKDLKMGLTQIPNNGEEKLVFDFDTEQKCQDWIVTCDSTWGEGYSTATLTESKGKALFSGELVTRPPLDGRTQHAGYCNMRSVYRTKSFQRVTTLDWEHFTHLIIKFRGDGRTYMINLHYYSDMDVSWNDIMQYPLFTRGGPYWQTAVVSLTVCLLIKAKWQLSLQLRYLHFF